MSDYDRGSYAPTDRFAFDPRQPVRGGGPAPTTLFVSALVLIVIIGGVLFLYRNGFRHHGDAPAVVGTPVTQMKVQAPPEATNDATAPQQLTIEKVNPANTLPAFRAPPPETPLPRPVAGEASAPVVAQAAPKQVVVAAKPAPKLQELTIASIAASAGTGKPVAKAAAAKPAQAKIAAAPATATGVASVQIGAFSTAALASKGWSDVAKLEAGAMSGKGKKVEPVDAGGKSLFRAYVTGFASHDAAVAFCGKLQAAGKACIVK